MNTTSKKNYRDLKPHIIAMVAYLHKQSRDRGAIMSGVRTGCIIDAFTTGFTSYFVDRLHYRVDFHPMKRDRIDHRSHVRVYYRVEERGGITASAPTVRKALRECVSEGSIGVNTGFGAKWHFIHEVRQAALLRNEVVAKAKRVQHALAGQGVKFTLRRAEYPHREPVMYVEGVENIGAIMAFIELGGV